MASSIYHGYVNDHYSNSLPDLIESESELACLDDKAASTLRKEVDFNNRKVFLPFVDNFKGASIYQIREVANTAFIDLVHFCSPVQSLSIPCHFSAKLIISTPKTIEKVSLNFLRSSVLEEPEFRDFDAKFSNEWAQLYYKSEDKFETTDFRELSLLVPRSTEFIGLSSWYKTLPDERKKVLNSLFETPHSYEQLIDFYFNSDSRIDQTEWFQKFTEEEKQAIKTFLRESIKYMEWEKDSKCRFKEVMKRLNNPGRLDS